MSDRVLQTMFYFACFLIAILPLIGLLGFYAGLHRWFG